jgi:hypothetical protein
MLRIGLTLYLIVATAAGPWLCCCSALWLAYFRPAGKQQTSAKAHAETPHACCHCRPAAVDEGRPALRASPGQTCKTSSGCACRDWRPELVPDNKPSPERSLDPAAFARLLPVQDTPDLASLALTVLNSPGGGPCAFPGARDSLYARHVLRC